MKDLPKIMLIRSGKDAVAIAEELNEEAGYEAFGEEFINNATMMLAGFRVQDAKMKMANSQIPSAPQDSSKGVR